MNHSYIFKELTTLEEMLIQHPLLQQLQPKLTYEEYKSMLPEMIRYGYFQVGVFENDKCIGLSGIWINAKLYSGKYLEMDNVIIDENYRSKGVGKLLTDWCIHKAKETNCKKVMLDAYLENEKAHQFYEREGFVKRGFHFIKQIL